MRHARIGAVAAIAWAVAIAAGLGANSAAALSWLLPIAAAATVALAVRAVRTVAWAFPIAAAASIDPAATGPRTWLVLLSVAAALLGVGLLDAWADDRPGRPAARIADPADLAAWRADRRRPLAVLAAVVAAASIGWVALTAVSWSPSGWFVAMVPAAAVIAIAVALWPQHRTAADAWGGRTAHVLGEASTIGAASARLRYGSMVKSFPPSSGRSGR